VAWLTHEARRVGAKIGGIESAPDAVRQALSHLPLTQKKDIFKIQVTPSTDYEHVLLLSYYRNTLIGYFVDQSYVAVTLVGFGHEISVNEGVPRERLEEEAAFVGSMLEIEFVTPRPPNYQRLLDSETICLTSDESKMKIANESKINFLCSLIWPYIDAYWITSVYLVSLRHPVAMDKLIS
jgi:glycerone phosphate O-acyltransferase/fatty acyl-CoA reductase